MGKQHQASSSRCLDLANVDPHKMDSLNRRIVGDASQGGITESSFTPPRNTSMLSNLGLTTDDADNGGDTADDNPNGVSSSRVGNITSSLLAASAAGIGEASHSSCQTVHHANTLPDNDTGTTKSMAIGTIALLLIHLTMPSEGDEAHYLA